jgi:hypothetical protein
MRYSEAVTAPAGFHTTSVVEAAPRPGVAESVAMTIKEILRRQPAD